MKIKLLAVSLLFLIASCHSLSKSTLTKKELTKDIELVTSEGTIVLRLYDQTPLSRNNFLSLVKEGLYDSLLFHRVIEKFMVQAGERSNEESFQKKIKPLNLSQTVLSEINT